MPDEAVDFEDENAQDGDKAIEYSRTLKMDYNQDSIEFWFTQLENEMFTCGIKSQWMKRCILVKNLPPQVQSDVMSLLILKKSEAPDDIYKQVKLELLRIHAPKQEDNFKKALQRVLVGLPSQLGQTLIADICDKPKKLEGCCCAKAVYSLWCLQLPLTVRTHVSTMPFNSATYRDVFKQADTIFLSTKVTEVSPAVAAVSGPHPVDKPQVAATQSGKGGGGGNNKGQGKNNKNKNNRGSGSGKSRIRHASNPSESCCDNHYRWSSDAWFCLDPTSCPMADKCKPRPTKNKN